MPKCSKNPNRRLMLLLCLLATCWIGASCPASAFGMFGFGRGHPMMGPPAWRRLPPHPPGRGIGRYPGRPGMPGRHPPIADGGAIGGGVIGSGAPPAGNGNNGGGGGAAAAATNPPYIVDEIVTSFAPGTTPAAIDQFARRYDLTAIETQNFALIGTSLYRWRIGDGHSVAAIVQSLGADNLVASVQPNYLFALQEDAAKTVPAKPAATGDPAQYVLAALQIADAQQRATGKNVAVAVIDSEIDASHPDLEGTIAENFDAVGGSRTPQEHGTAIAGAIAAHGKLRGIAPGARVLAVHAFDATPGEAKSTSFAIDKALQWAADNGARIVNMSFAGPADPMLARFVAAAFAKGIVLIAAAGNGGPQSEPLYPAADPDVIAVTATDDADHLFKLANRGRYIAVAAPGVDILALAPGGAYALSTGTSIAAAHVSGIAALLLELRPTLTPTEVRGILIATAKQVGPPTPDSPFGAGLVNAYRAVTWLDHKPAALVVAPAGGAQAKQ